MGGYLAYTEYKESGIEWLGKVPAHWQLKKLQHIARLRSGETMTAQMMNENDEFPVYGGNGLRGYFNFYTHDGNYVLIGRQGALCGNINYGSGKFWASEHAVVVSPTIELETFWLGELLRTMNLNQYSTSAAQPGISVEQIARLKIPFPPVEEQRSIARFLNYKTAQIDALITKKETLLKKLAEKRTALISQAVTKGCDRTVPLKDSGIEWLGEIPAHWETSRLKFVSKIIDCKNRTPEYFDNGGYLVVRTSNVRGGKLILTGAYYTDEENFKEWTKRGIPPVGSVLFTREAPAGEVCLVPENTKLCMGQRMMNFTLNNGWMNRFILYFLSSQYFFDFISAQSSGSTVTHLRVEQVYSIDVVVPPKEEAIAICQFIECEDKKILKSMSQVSLAIQTLKEYRTALITNAVTGKIDVRDVMLELEPVEAA